MQTAVRRLVSHQLSAAWTSWREAVQLSKDKQGKAQRALSYLTNSTQRHAFDAWRSHLQGSVEKQHKLAKALTYFTKGNMHRTFDSWRGECNRAAEKRQLMRKAANLLLHSGLAKVQPAVNIAKLCLLPSCLSTTLQEITSMRNNLHRTLTAQPREELNTPVHACHTGCTTGNLCV